MYSIPTAERKERIGQFLDGLQLRGHENELISGYSQGMKQKVAIISALLHRPKVLVLDEALNGLDPRSAKLVKDLLRNLADEGDLGPLQHARPRDSRGALRRRRHHVSGLDTRERDGR